MTMLEDDRPKKPVSPQPGESLADLSVDELQARIAIYRSEIERLERDIETKEKSRSAADAVFRF